MRKGLPRPLVKISDFSGVPLVLDIWLIGGIAYRYDAEGSDTVGEEQCFAGISYAVAEGIYAAPYSAEAEGMSCEEEVLSGSGAVLHPVFATFALEEAALVATHGDGEGSMVEHSFSVRELGGYRVEARAVSDNDEMPGLRVDSRGRRHGSTQESFDGVL